MSDSRFNSNSARSTEKREWAATQILHADPNDFSILYVLQELVGHTYTDDPERTFHKADKFKTRVLKMRMENGGNLVNINSSDSKDYDDDSGNRGR